MNYQDQYARDLTQFDAAYARAEVYTASGLVPDGTYEARVEKAELGETRSSGRPRLSWQLRILGPEHQGRLVWKNAVFGTAESLNWAKTDLKICGLDLDKLSDLPDRLEELVDVLLEIRIVTRGDNRRVYFQRRLERR